MQRVPVMLLAGHEEVERIWVSDFEPTATRRGTDVSTAWSLAGCRADSLRSARDRHTESGLIPPAERTCPPGLRHDRC